jgi:hypothetical protein
MIRPAGLQERHRRYQLTIALNVNEWIRRRRLLGAADTGALGASAPIRRPSRRSKFVHGDPFQRQRRPEQVGTSTPRWR